MATITETHLSVARLSRRGKVRELYDLGDSLLLVASDRISAFDVVLTPGIPDKGKILTQLSNFWFQKFSDVENHLLETDVARFPEELRADAGVLAGRSVIARKCEVVPFECVARGYLAGSGWAEYRKTGHVCGIRLREGLREADQLPEPIFTPATKAETGHDENISFETMARALPPGEAATLRDLTLSLYERASEHATSRGLILADTKLEFGRFDGRIVWIDEAFTPDSSRYWDAAHYAPGRGQPSFDKQFVRDWLDSTGWDKRPPAPKLPEGVVRTTREKYLDAYRKLTDAMPEHLEGERGMAQ
ncbi:MAG: phosphoribosylaminoimidazolesuccinocarboxamide synthase [Thermoanaerobaculia bacterium]